MLTITRGVRRSSQRWWRACADSTPRGFFDVADEREKVMLFISISDSDVAEEVETPSVRQLNPPEATANLLPSAAIAAPSANPQQRRERTTATSDKIIGRRSSGSRVNSCFMASFRLFACLLGLVALALSFYAYEEYIRLLGFPDGHITELGAAEKKLAVVFITLSLPLGSHLLYLGIAADPRKVGARQVVTVILYVLVLVGASAVHHFLETRLDGGIGG